MAYNTRYRLEWNKDTGPTAQEIAQALEENIRESDRGLPTIFNQKTWQEVIRGDLETSWYNHKKDMAYIVSRKWPQVRFELYGKGDEDDDAWVEYYLGQRMHQAQAEIRYPEFDSEKLAEPDFP